MQKSNRVKTIVFIIVLVLVLAGLFVYPRFADPNRQAIKRWKAAGVDCLPAHAQAVLHIHPVLTVIVDGAKETVPADVGIVPFCMAELHTHDASGTIHVESVSYSKEFTLGQFLEMWGKPIQRQGYRLVATLGGEPIENPGTLVLKDGQDIVLTYIRDNEP